MLNWNLLFLLALGIYAAIFAAVAHFTRAGPRRIRAALAGGLAVAVVGIGVEALAHRLGWWHYGAAIDTPVGPPLIYPVVVPMFAAVALIGWRVVRRWGARGEVVFLAAIAVIGVARDLGWAAARPDLFIVGPGPGPWLVDVACWAGLTALAQAVMRAVAGPAGDDPLSR